MAVIRNFQLKITSCWCVVLFFFVSCGNTAEQHQNVDPLPDQEQLMERQGDILELENQEIDSYTSRHGYSMNKTGTGLRYQILEKGSGIDSIMTGDQVKMNYTVSLLDGTLLYSSDSSGVLEFRVDKSDMASGIHEGVKFMKPGDEAVFIMPSHLAYGLTGDGGKVTNYKVLVVNVELLTVIKEE
jgi:FKBP-type peptidyl-prolyl cis-trans isomerase